MVYPAMFNENKIFLYKTKIFILRLEVIRETLLASM